MIKIIKKIGEKLIKLNTCTLLDAKENKICGKMLSSKIGITD